jgi:SRSO17 transposase
VTTYQSQVAVEAAIAQTAWDRLFGAAMDAIADCFARREPRATAAEMVTGLPAEVDTRNCWTLAEVLGHPGPHRLRHLLLRASFGHERAREEIARLIVRELAGQDVVLVADETGDAKSSTDCVGAGRRYSGAIKGVGLCQIAVHLAAVIVSVRVVIDRALYLLGDWAADEERRDDGRGPRGDRVRDEVGADRRHGQERPRAGCAGWLVRRRRRVLRSRTPP